MDAFEKASDKAITESLLEDHIVHATRAAGKLRYRAPDEWIVKPLVESSTDLKIYIVA